MSTELPVNDEATTIQVLRELVATFVHERNWEQFHNPKDLAAAIAIEASELQELFLWMSPTDAETAAQEPETLQHIQEELADIVIFSLSLANHLKLDVTTAMLEKVASNRRKYPVEKAKGSSRKYTSL